MGFLVNINYLNYFIFAKIYFIIQVFFPGFPLACRQVRGSFPSGLSFKFTLKSEVGVRR